VHIDYKHLANTRIIREAKKKREKRKKNKEILISSNDAARAFSSDLLPFKNKTELLSWLLLQFLRAVTLLFSGYLLLLHRN